MERVRQFLAKVRGALTSSGWAGVNDPGPRELVTSPRFFSRIFYA